MSIPLDRLYYYIESVAEEIRNGTVLIYRFLPDGSKKLEDLSILDGYTDLEAVINPEVYCNDQEPLDFDYYQSYEVDRNTPLQNLIKKYSISSIIHNLRINAQNIYDRSIILHSEQRSENVKKYLDNGFIPVYYWSHAVIARDWFRYAEHIQQKKHVQQLFLVYNRAWSGTREYRLGFADRLIMNGLVNHVLMRVSPVDSTIDKHYDLHHFKHTHWRPQNVIEKYFPLCTAESHYSADFDQEDYKSTAIEVVLETLFDDLRLHLTEKTLRPIAMGQPFILAGTYGSLKYLREYGFKTFSDCWDESYDMMTDSLERMNKITDIMSNIVSMPKSKREEMLVKARAIAEYNKEHFFGDEFKKLVETELTNNFKYAFDELEKTNTSDNYLVLRKSLATNQEIKEYLLTKNSRQELITILTQAKKYNLRSLSNK